MKKIISTLAGIFIFGILPFYSSSIFAQENKIEEKPNVIFIAIDDLNNWLGCLGGHPNAITPNIDKLARRGVLFTHAYCQAPICGPSRASLMTGLRPSSTGIYGMIDDNKIKSDNPVTQDIIFLPDYFKQNGYYTMGIGKLFHEHAPVDMFDESGGRYPGFGPYPEKRFKWEGKGGPGYGNTSTDWGAFPKSDNLMPDFHSTQWAIDRLKRDYEKPFFLAVGYLRPHVPWYVPLHWFDGFDPQNLTLPNYKLDDLNDVPEIGLKINDLPMMPYTGWALNSGEYKNIVQAYLACIKFVDDQVGKLLDALDSSIYSKNTIIVLWSDHGYRLGEKGTFGKHVLWEESVKAPLIIIGPNIHERKIITNPVELLSIYPTLLEMCNLPKYKRNEGISLVPLIYGGGNNKEYYAITTLGVANHSIRSENFRYIRYEDGSEELYDHRVDPHEWYNVAKDPFYLEIIKKLKNHLPSVNVPWNVHSTYDYIPYFRKQRKMSILNK